MMILEPNAGGGIMGDLPVNAGWLAVNGVIGIVHMEREQRTDPRKRDRAQADAQNVWLRMVSLWETRPAHEAVKEMGRILAREGWIDKSESADLSAAHFQIYVMQEYLCDKGSWGDYSGWSINNVERLAAEYRECADGK